MVSSRRQRALQRLDYRPPLLRFGIGFHFRHIGEEIGSDVFVIRKKKSIAEIDGIIPNIAFVYLRGDLGPHLAVIVDVRVNTVGFYSDHFPMTNHDFPHPGRFLWDGLATTKRHVNSLQLSKTHIVNCARHALERMALGVCSGRFVYRCATATF